MSYKLLYDIIVIYSRTSCRSRLVCVWSSVICITIDGQAFRLKIDRKKQDLKIYVKNCLNLKRKSFLFPWIGEHPKSSIFSVEKSKIRKKTPYDTSQRTIRDELRSLRNFLIEYFNTQAYILSRPACKVGQFHIGFQVILNYDSYDPFKPVSISFRPVSSSFNQLIFRISFDQVSSSFKTVLSVFNQLQSVSN